MTPDDLDELMKSAVEVINETWTDSPQLTALGNSMAKLSAIQREQVAQLQAEGVTDADLKAWEKARKSPVAPRTTLSVEKVRGWHEKAMEKAQRAEEKAVRSQAAIDARAIQFDHGMLNMPLGPRQKQAETTQRIYREMVEAQGRATHYRHVARKHAAWIEKNEVKA